MSIRVLTLVWQASRSKSGDLLVLLGIADFANDDGVAWPSVDTLAAKARMTPRNVQRAVRRLISAGEVVVEPGAGPHGVNRYRVTLCQGDILSGCHDDGVTNCRDDKSGTGGVTPTSPNPSEESVRENIPITTGDKLSPRSGRHSGLSRRFLEFWAAYPKKKSKATAQKAYSALKPDEQLHARILAALKQAKTSDQWQKEDGQFIPHPATWLRAHGWEDEYDVMTGSSVLCRNLVRVAGESRRCGNPVQADQATKATPLCASCLREVAA